MFSTKSNTSSMRINLFICVCVGCLIGLLGVVLNRDLTATGLLVGAILTPAFGSKWLQSKEELKNAKE